MAPRHRECYVLLDSTSGAGMHALVGRGHSLPRAGGNAYYASSSWMGSPVRSSSELAIFTGLPMGLMYSLVQSMPSVL
jgi:hypothetical protein